jgi:XRE family transcriptional regulator, regulator of sulfur utilization
MEHPPPVGKHIQKIRSSQKLTLNILAERSGVSKAMLSQIESNKVNPTVATVWKIAQGLGVDIHELLAGAENRERNFSVKRFEQNTPLDTDVEGVLIHVLSPLSMVEDLELYLLTFDPASALISEPHFPNSEEFLTVILGKVKVQAGDRETVLGRGDFISYHCDVSHSITNIGRGKAVVHMVVRYNDSVNIR